MQQPIQPKRLALNYAVLESDGSPIKEATFETRDGSVYIIKNGTIHKRKVDSTKRLSPSKRARQERRASELNTKTVKIVVYESGGIK